MNHQNYGTRDWIVRVDDAAGRLVCIAAGIALDKSEAEDIVHQAIEIALRKSEMRFETEAQFMAWLAGVVRKCALNHRKKTIRRKTSPVDPQTFSEIQTSIIGRGENDLPFEPESGNLKHNQQDFDDRVKNALETLGAEARICLLLRSVQRLSYQEIEELTSIPSASAMSHVHRSRLKLREILGESSRTEGGKND